MKPENYGMVSHKHEIPADVNLISYCGFYCGACPKFLHHECLGCKGDDPGCAMGCKSCRVRFCCIENGYSSCADCKKYESARACKKYNPFLIRLGQFLTHTSRRKGIDMIKEKGETEFMKFMTDKRWVTIKKE